MVLNQLKQIRDELKSSADAYDTAFMNTALIAASELSELADQTKPEQKDQPKLLINNQQSQSSLNPVLDKEYFIAKYGSLKNANSDNSDAAIKAVFIKALS